MDYESMPLPRRTSPVDAPSDNAHAHCHADFRPTTALFNSPEFVLRVFRADPTPPTPPTEALLRPPAIEKNFLISPPGSPPVGWEQVVEEPPNVTPLADDLITALCKLQLAAGAAARGGREMILDPEDGAGIGVYVEDCDVEGLDVDEEERDWVYGEDNPSRMVYQHIPTALPPMVL